MIGMLRLFGLGGDWCVRGREADLLAIYEELRLYIEVYDRLVGTISQLGS